MSLDLSCSINMVPGVNSKIMVNVWLSDDMNQQLCYMHACVHACVWKGGGDIDR